jgi:exodeoxyribonuclease VIII
MDNATYHAHSAVSKSHLDLVAKSPLHFWARYLDPNRVPQEPTAAMQIGSAVHTHILELDQWDAQYVVAPAGIDRRTKVGKAEWEVFQTAIGTRTVISREDADLVMRIGRSVLSHPAAAYLLGLPGKAETTHMWVDEISGLQCKCRPDWLLDDGSMIVDLKTTTEDASPRGFQKSIAQWRYHIQASWYLDGLQHATGKRPEQFVFIAVEKKPPYACAVYVADQQMIEIGRDTARRDLDKLNVCKAADYWPGYSDGIEQINLPPWMLPKADGTMPTPNEIETF